MDSRGHSHDSFPFAAKRVVNFAFFKCYCLSQLHLVVIAPIVGLAYRQNINHLLLRHKSLTQAKKVSLWLQPCARLLLHVHNGFTQSYQSSKTVSCILLLTKVHALLKQKKCDRKRQGSCFRRLHQMRETWLRSKVEASCWKLWLLRQVVSSVAFSDHFPDHW